MVDLMLMVLEKAWQNGQGIPVHAGETRTGFYCVGIKGSDLQQTWRQ